VTVSRETDSLPGFDAENPALRLRTVCLQNGFSVTDTQIAQLARFVELLLEWNQKINLVSRKSTNEVWRNHILHSISILFVLELQRGASVMDIGTGGGLPGIPLKILRPDLAVTLVDSIQKKVKAVEAIMNELKLVGIDVLCDRVEDMPKRKGLKASFDYAIARGVAPMKDLVKYSMPVLRRRTEQSREKSPEKEFQVIPPALIAFKGGNVGDELKQVKELKGIISAKVVNLTLKGSEQLIDLEKKVIVVRF
jgi:16S rRNA (guanine527-N7)-methyltransferase